MRYLQGLGVALVAAVAATEVSAQACYGPTYGSSMTGCGVYQYMHEVDGDIPSWLSNPTCDDTDDADDLGWIVGMVADFHRFLTRSENCLACQLALVITAALPALGAIGFGALVGPMFIIGAGLLGIRVVYMAVLPMASAVAPTADDWRRLVAGTVPVVLALILLAPALGGVDLFTVALQTLVAPAMNLAIYLGFDLVHELAAVRDDGRYTLSEVIHSGESDVAALIAQGQAGGSILFGDRNVGMPAMQHGLVSLAYSMHMVAGVGMLRALAFLSDSFAASAGVSMMVGIILAALMLVLFISFLVTSGIRLLDPLLRVVIVAAVLPVIVLAAAFPATRPVSGVAFRIFLYALFYFVIVGAVFALALQIIMYGLQADCLLALFQGHSEEARRLAQCGSTCRSSSLDAEGNLVLLDAFVVVIMLMVAQGLVGMASSLAGTLAGASGAGQLGDQVEAQTRGLGVQMVGIGAHAFIGAVGIAGRVAGGAAKLVR